MSLLWSTAAVIEFTCMKGSMQKQYERFNFPLYLPASSPYLYVFLIGVLKVILFDWESRLARWETRGGNLLLSGIVVRACAIN